jgi:hypothetical protein
MHLSSDGSFSGDFATTLDGGYLYVSHVTKAQANGVTINDKSISTNFGTNSFTYNDDDQTKGNFFGAWRGWVNDTSTITTDGKKTYRTKTGIAGGPACEFFDLPVVKARKTSSKKTKCGTASVKTSPTKMYVNEAFKVTVDTTRMLQSQKDNLNNHNFLFCKTFANGTANIATGCTTATVKMTKVDVGEPVMVDGYEKDLKIATLEITVSNATNTTHGIYKLVYKDVDAGVSWPCLDSQFGTIEPSKDNGCKLQCANATIADAFNVSTCAKPPCSAPPTCKASLCPEATHTPKKDLAKIKGNTPEACCDCKMCNAITCNAGEAKVKTHAHIANATKTCGATKAKCCVCNKCSAHTCPSTHQLNATRKNECHGENPNEKCCELKPCAKCSAHTCPSATHTAIEKAATTCGNTNAKCCVEKSEKVKAVEEKGYKTLAPVDPKKDLVEAGISLTGVDNFYDEIKRVSEKSPENAQKVLKNMVELTINATVIAVKATFEVEKRRLAAGDKTLVVQFIAQTKGAETVDALTADIKKLSTDAATTAKFVNNANKAAAEVAEVTLATIAEVKADAIVVKATIEPETVKVEVKKDGDGSSAGVLSGAFAMALTGVAAAFLQ